MTILLTGGGTGGHITPLLAVAHELRQLQPDTKLLYVGERGGRFAHLASNRTDIDGTRLIFAGKFRRYHGQSWFSRLIDLKTNFLNLRDAVLVLIGFCQALWLLMRTKPDVIFIKGGYVGVPVGLAAAILGVPFITHDSDTVPGLANRIIGRWAKLHATGMPADFYKYPKAKTKYVGIPLNKGYKYVTPEVQKEYRRHIGIPEDARLVFITGGSLGAQRLNTVVHAAMPKLLAEYPDLYVIHQVGKGNMSIYDDLERRSNKLTAVEFLDEMYLYSGAADVIVSRGGATQIAEYALQQKAVILVPHPQLTGGHQLKNAQHMASYGSALVLQEKELLKRPELLATAIEELLNNTEVRNKLSAAIATMAKPDAAKELARLILETKK